MKNLNLKIMRPKGFHSRIEKIVEKAQQNVKIKVDGKQILNVQYVISEKKIWLKRTI